MTDNQSEDYGAGANAIIAFVSGPIFKLMCLVGIVAGIGIALFRDGGIPTSRVPAVTETDYNFLKNNRAGARSVPATHPGSDSQASRRYRAMQQQN